MTTAIEQLIKMHDPRCVSIEALNIGRGRAVLSQEQLLGAFASCQHKYPVGFDILMTKYRRDCKAEQRVRSAISVWLHQRPHPVCAIAACQLALNMVLERTLPAQVEHIATLLRRYGSRTKISRKVIEDVKQQIKLLERDKAQARDDEIITELASQIHVLLTKIRIERNVLRSWAHQQAAITEVCPRCHGAGKTLRPHPEVCNECGGRGRLIATMEHLRKSMGFVGAQVSAREWVVHYLPLVNKCMQWLYIEETEAVKILTDRIKTEY